MYDEIDDEIDEIDDEFGIQLKISTSIFSSSPPQLKIRSNFPESWIWEHLQNGLVELKLFFYFCSA